MLFKFSPAPSPLLYNYLIWKNLLKLKPHKKSGLIARTLYDENPTTIAHMQAKQRWIYSASSQKAGTRKKIWIDFHEEQVGRLMHSSRFGFWVVVKMASALLKICGFYYFLVFLCPVKLRTTWFQPFLVNKILFLGIKIQKFPNSQN